MFIFDKKTTIMSRYSNGTCQLIDTKLPNTGSGAIVQNTAPVFPEIMQPQMIQPSPQPVEQRHTQYQSNAQQMMPQPQQNQFMQPMR